MSARWRRRALGRHRVVRELALPELQPPWPAGPAPLVSIVVATFNRSNVLVHALESVRRQTCTDWELLVVGDACTDDTAAVVAGLDDQRIRFVDLPQNLGEQSGPNTIGARLVRGRYLAWLNHDDLWFPEHLERLVALLATADLAWSPWITVPAQEEADVAAGRWRVWLDGAGRGPHAAGTWAPASTWLLERSLVERLGAWRPASECFAASSADFLYRAWAVGARIQRSPEPTVVVVASGHSPGCYRERRDLEHVALSAVLRGEPAARASLVAAARAAGVEARSPGAFEGWVAATQRRRPSTPTRRMRRVARLQDAVLARLGVAPRSWRMRRAGVRRGEYVAILGSARGFAPAPDSASP